MAEKRRRRSIPLTLDKAKKIFPEYRYAVCDVATRYPVWLCNSIDDARETVEDMWKCSGAMCFIVDLQSDRILKLE